MPYILSIWCLCVVLLLLGVVYLPLSLVVFPLPLPWRLTVLAPSARLISWICLRFGSGMRPIVRDARTERNSRQGLVIANHQGFYDIPLLLLRCPRPPIMKWEVLYIPFAGLAGLSSGAIPLKRESTNSRKKVLEKAKSYMRHPQIGLFAFPEGTRSKTGRPKPFGKIHKALLYSAYEANTIVTPVGIAGTRGILSWDKGLKWGQKAGIHVGAPLSPADYASAHEFSSACWACVEELQKGLIESLQQS